MTYTIPAPNGQMYSSTRVKTWLYFWLGCRLCHRQRWKKVCRGVVWYTCETCVFNFHPLVLKSKFSFCVWVKRHPIILWEHNDPVGQLLKILSPRGHHHWAFLRPLNILAQQVLDKGVPVGQWNPCVLGRSVLSFFPLSIKWVSCSEALMCEIPWLWLINGLGRW